MSRARPRGGAVPTGAEAIRPCVLYARVSSREQELEGFSVPSQSRLLHGYCQAHQLDPVKEFVDVESAKNPGARNAFGEMLTFLRRNRTVHDAVCEKTDRFYRNFRDYVSVDELQVSLHFPKENVVLSHDSTSHEKFMHGIKVLMAKNYIDNLSEEVRKGMLEKCEQGGWPAQAPLGYVNIIREDKKRVVVVDAERAQLIRKLYETYARGAHSVRQVAKLARGWGLTFRKSGAPVSTATVHNILRNRFYCGDFVWDGRTYRGAHETLVTRDLWHRVQDVLDGRNAIHPKRRKHQFLFAGLIRCGHCGCAMVTERHKGRYHYLRCTGNRGKCPTGYTRQEVIESHVATLLDRMTFPEPALKYLITALRESDVDEKKFHDEAIARLEAEYDVIQKRLDAMYLDKLDGRITAAYFDRMAADWRDEQDRIAEAIHEHRQANRGQIADGARILEVASEAGAVFRGQEDDSEKRELLRFFLAESSWTENGLAASLRQPFDVLAGEAEKLRRIEGSNGGDKVHGPAGGRLNSSGDRDSNSRAVAQGSDRAKIEIWSGPRDLNPGGLTAPNRVVALSSAVPPAPRGPTELKCRCSDVLT